MVNVRLNLPAAVTHSVVSASHVSLHLYENQDGKHIFHAQIHNSHVTPPYSCSENKIKQLPYLTIRFSRVQIENISKELQLYIQFIVPGQGNTAAYHLPVTALAVI